MVWGSCTCSEVFNGLRSLGADTSIQIHARPPFQNIIPSPLGDIHGVRDWQLVELGLNANAYQ